jgi:hypothetical protein
VNNDGSVSPIDALLLINYINSHPIITPLPLPRPVGAPFYDVNGDGVASASDVLDVVNRINQLNSPLGGEGEGSLAPAPIAAESRLGELFVLQDGLAASLAGGASLTQPLLEQTREQRPTDDRRTAADVAPTAPQSRLRRSADRDTVRIDRLGLEDVLDAIAADVGDSFSDATPLDEILAEIVG